MEPLRVARVRQALSQRRLAKLAGISYKSVQLIESGKHDPRLSTLQSLAKALGYPRHSVRDRVASVFQQPTDSVAVVSGRMEKERGDSWKTWLFNFVDAYRRDRDEAYIEAPPAEEASPRIKALLASVVETLCEETEASVPLWCRAVPPLLEPWFLSGTENLKALALRESPVHFRKRSIFVLGNFLSRA